MSNVQINTIVSFGLVENILFLIFLTEKKTLDYNSILLILQHSGHGDPAAFLCLHKGIQSTKIVFSLINTPKRTKILTVLCMLRGEYELDVENGHLIFGVDWEKTISDRKIKFRT